MTLAEMRHKFNEAITGLEELRAKDEMSADDEARAQALINEINDLGPKIQLRKNMENATAEFVTKESRGTVAGVVPDERAAQHQQQQSRGPRKSIGQRMIESDDFKRLQERQGNGVATLELASLFEERTLVTTGSLPTDYLEPQRIPGFQRPSDPFGSLRDVLTVGQTNSDALIFFQETAFTNNAEVVGEATATDGTSGTKPESALSFDQKTSAVETIAHWIPITKQTLWNAPELRTYIEGRLIDGLRMVEDDQLLNGDGSSGNMTGLLNVSGVQALDGTYFAANPVAGAGTDNELFNRILRARTLIATVGRAQANFVVLNPMDHERLMVTTDAQQQYFGAGPFAAGNVPTLWGLRTVINENMAEGTALVGDGRQATIWDRMQAQVSVGTIDKQFIRNMLTLLAEERVGLTVFRPQAFAEVELDVTAAGGGD